jgi:mono/diheme cytochrome c family protein
VAALWIAGLQQGYTWVGAVNAGVPGGFGEGFRSSVVPLEGLLLVRSIGLALFLAASAVAVIGLLPAVRRAEPEAAGSGEPGPGTPVRVVWQGAVALLLTAGLAVFVLPAVEADEPPSMLAETSRRAAPGSDVDRGRDLYVAEGCWQCHTQQVRPIVTDVGLGPVSQAGDYAYEEADVLGFVRIGPDLGRAGSREGTGDPDWVRGHLADPRANRPWSTMPSYAHLSAQELDSLAAYVASLE